MADACRDTDLFVVGTELDLTVGHEDAWRSLIKQVRARTNAPITFASNWDAFERVPFWDALDYVGIQAYFPISRAAHPSERDLEEGWEGLVRRLRAYSLNVQKPIVLTELGYNQSEKAASEPWSYQVHDGMEDLQARCMSIALNAIASEPSIVGSFLWKWFPEPRPVGRNFQLATPKMQSAIKEIWGTEREGSGRDVEGEPGD